ncbi:hypothetical protein BpHYR1_038327 [Brachionus plicatilis]|uniref:Uncharacterized protein n=1 Tax=Brachionus plicatilis TaxID=10195 RepID=A0A3M7SGS2_BRAPC|nr:hypothetical protein BpHYR1_038327 [Brachionus plicatilis]
MAKKIIFRFENTKKCKIKKLIILYKRLRKILISVTIENEMNQDFGTFSFRLKFRTKIEPKSKFEKFSDI